MGSWFSSWSSNRVYPSNTLVVVIGGGYGGIAAATALQNQGVPFVLVDPKEYFLHNVGMLRAAVFDENDCLDARKIMIPFGPTFGGRHIRAKVSKIDVGAKRIHFDRKTTFEGREDVEDLAFSCLIVAVGSTGPYPSKSDIETMQELKVVSREMTDDFQQALNMNLVPGYVRANGVGYR